MIDDIQDDVLNQDPDETPAVDPAIEAEPEPEPERDLDGSIVMVDVDAEFDASGERVTPDPEQPPAVEPPIDGLILGKFKTAEELQAAYIELEREKGRLANEIGGLRQTAPDTAPGQIDPLAELTRLSNMPPEELAADPPETAVRYAKAKMKWTDDQIEMATEVSWARVQQKMDQDIAAIEAEARESAIQQQQAASQHYDAFGQANPDLAPWVDVFLDTAAEQVLRADPMAFQAQDFPERCAAQMRSMLQQRGVQLGQQPPAASAPQGQRPLPKPPLRPNAGGTGPKPEPALPSIGYV